jgi:uncharacterized protein (DUF927 family)
MPLLDRSGWTKRYFALPSGEVFSPAGAKKAVALFPADPGLCRWAGKALLWKRGVPGRLAGQHVASFAVMTAFATPILALAREVGNFGFEIIGAKGNGKSTLLQILASTSGYPFPSADGHYGMSMNATVNGLEIAMQDYADLVMPLDEATLFDASGSAEPRRVCRRLFGLSHAAIGRCSIMA